MMALFLRCPAQFCEFDLKLKLVCLNRTYRLTESLPEKVLRNIRMKKCESVTVLFLEKLSSLLYIFPARCIGHFPRTKKNSDRASRFRLLHDKHLRVPKKLTYACIHTSKFVTLSAAWPVYTSMTTSAWLAQLVLYN